MGETLQEEASKTDVTSPDHVGVHSCSTGLLRRIVGVGIKVGKLCGVEHAVGEHQGGWVGKLLLQAASANKVYLREPT